MLNEKAIHNLINAPAEKRYKSFLNTVTDIGIVWFSVHKENNINVMYLWPRKELCLFNEEPINDILSIEVHTFVNVLNSFEDNTVFNVFPNVNDSFKVGKKKLYEDIVEYLNRIE